MLFNSLTFLVFFAIVLSLHVLPFPWRVKKFNLLIASYIFYAAWNPPFVILIWISTVADWYAGKWLSRAEKAVARRWILAFSLAVNFGLLGFFKYGNFLLENFIFVMKMIGITYQPAPMGIILPIGISFYTFQTLSYTFDIYYRKNQSWHSFLDYALYVTFFPQLVAGPIVRSGHFLPQCLEPKKVIRQQLGWGLSLLILGLFEKVFVADFLMAPIAERVYDMGRTPGFFDAWLGTFAFSVQIFCDFAGYSTCAIGIALCLGFVVPANFRFPYAAVGFSDFWKRWHISLSSWLRDYLYIPLGGNRKGKIRMHANLMMTMLWGGLWHGASWTFVVWGGLHGIYLWGDRWIRSWSGIYQWSSVSAVRWFMALVTYLLVCLAWVFFRSHGFEQALTMGRVMVGFGGDFSWPTLLSAVQVRIVVLTTAAVLTLHSLLKDSSLERVAVRIPWWARYSILGFLLVLILATAGASQEFIYFQF